MTDPFLWIANFAILTSVIVILLTRDWRVSLGMLTLMYLGMFILVSAHWPIGMAAAKLVTGWMSAAILGMTQSGVERFSDQEMSWPEGRLFRLLIASLVIIAVVSLAPSLLVWLPGIKLPVAIGGTILIGLGLLQLGITIQPLRVAIGLLIILCGFEILYASIENSILVAALLSVINLGLALVGAFLINADQPSLPEEQAG